MPRGRPAAPDAAHRRVADELRKRMLKLEWPPGSPLPSNRNLAREYGVSARVTQLACELLRRDGLTSLTPQRRVIVRDPDSPGTCIENQILALLTANPAYLIKDYYEDLFLGLLSGAGELNSPIFFAYDDRLRISRPVQLLERPLRAVVLAGKISMKALRAWERVSVPVILADHPGTNVHLHASGVDNEGAMRESVRQLWELGHRQIAFMRRLSTRGLLDVDPDSRDRQVIFEKEIRCLGGRPRVNSVFPYDSAASPAFQSIVNKGRRATAVITADGGIAAMVAQAYERAGLKAPADYSLVSFGALAKDAPRCSGPHFDFYEVGRNAVCLAAQPRQPVQHLKAPYRWVDGGTTGPCSR